MSKFNLIMTGDPVSRSVMDDDKCSLGRILSITVGSKLLDDDTRVVVRVGSCTYHIEGVVRTGATSIGFSVKSNILKTQPMLLGDLRRLAGRGQKRSNITIDAPESAPGGFISTGAHVVKDLDRKFKQIIEISVRTL